MFSQRNSISSGLSLAVMTIAPSCIQMERDPNQGSDRREIFEIEKSNAVEAALKEERTDFEARLEEEVEKRLPELLARELPKLLEAERSRLFAEAVDAVKAERALELIRSGNDINGSATAGLMPLDPTLRKTIETRLPVVKLQDDESVGSGVVLARGDNGVSYVVTAWHVIRDIVSSADNKELMIEGHSYDLYDHATAFEAKLLYQDVISDLALIEVQSSDLIPAKFASSIEAASTNVFDSVIAVGCPLGEDPLPTEGIVSDVTHKASESNETYIMISAPTFIGNSGGGVFRAGDHKVIGLFSKIYTQGIARPTIIPHMGLATPVSKLHAFLQDNKFPFVLDEDGYFRPVGDRK